MIGHPKKQKQEQEQQEQKLEQKLSKRKAWKRWYAVFPLTTLGVVLIAIMLIGFSPGMDQVILRPADATLAKVSSYYLTTDENFVLTRVTFAGKPTAIAAGGQTLFEFDTDMTASAQDPVNVYVEPALVKGGSFQTLTIQMEYFDQFFTSKGYACNQTNLLTYVNITVYVESPANVVTNYYPLDQGTFTWMDLTSYAEYNIPDYTFNEGGVYEIGYTVKYYY